MATVTEVKLVDDLDGQLADETVQFAVDGRQYSIDLAADNANRLRETLTPFVSAARRSTRPRPRSRAAATSAPPSRSDREQTQAIRDWARRHGHKIAERGRIPADVMRAYNASGAGHLTA
jgi:hypothetical protein